VLIISASVDAQRTEKFALRAAIEGISKGEIYKEKLLSGNPILCSDPSIEIIYFSLSVFHKNGDLVVYNGQGNMLSEAMKAEIRSLETGSKLLIEDIGARTPGGKMIHLPSIQLVMK
jgi:hypothetical protein